MAEASVKICGLQGVEVLKSISNLPIDDIGFVFASSRRQVLPDMARRMMEQLKQWEAPVRPCGVGVFVNPDMDYLSRVMSRVPLDVIQLHGHESPQFCRDVKARFGTRIYKVMSVRAESSMSGPTACEGYAGVIDALLLDTFEPRYGGGSGETFAWDEIPGYLNWAHTHGIRLIVAGGLTPSNVEELIRNYAPDGVDVSSGVETNGTKDIDKIAAFVERVKGI